MSTQAMILVMLDYTWTADEEQPEQSSNGAARSLFLRLPTRNEVMSVGREKDSLEEQANLTLVDKSA